MPAKLISPGRIAQLRALREHLDRCRLDLIWRARMVLEERRTRREPRLFNAAHRRPARQSSTTGSSSEFGAQHGINGLVGSPGFFSTKREDRPWWSVELQTSWPIHSVRLHGRHGLTKTETFELELSISADGEQWTVVHRGVHRFDIAPSEPRVVSLGDKHRARFIKLESLRRGKLALNQVEVMVRETHSDLWRVSRRYGFIFEFMTSFLMRRHVKPYEVRDVPPSGRIEAFHINVTQGRFGNHLKQIGTAVSLAQRLGVPHVYLMNLPMSELDRPIRFGGVTILPDSTLEQTRPRGLLCGSFFFRRAFGLAARGMLYRDIAEAARAVGQPIFGHLAAPPLIVPTETDLAIHMRAGDIFARPDPHVRYIQPPLGFYQLCVDFARTQLGIQRVILVYEDEGNPCVGALRTWLEKIGFPYVAQSRTLEEDLAVLLAAQHCVFGRGSFGPAIATLSNTMRTVFYSWLEPEFAAISEVTGIRGVVVDDVAGGYIRIGDWHNTPEQKQAMLDYPIENLRLAAD